jgi:hypothetical protein
MSRQFFRSFHLISQYSMRKHHSNDYSLYNRVIHQVRVGIGFTPGDVPLRVW